MISLLKILVIQNRILIRHPTCHPPHVVQLVVVLLVVMTIKETITETRQKERVRAQAGVKVRKAS